MRTSVAIVYNKPYHSHYDAVGEEKAVLGVLEAVAAVHQALLKLDCNVVRVPLAPPLERVEKILGTLRTDLVFNIFEGLCGQPETEAIVPEILAANGIACTGCPGPMLRLALDKAKAKVILQSVGIATPKFQLLLPETLHMFRLNYPCIVKPRCEDASHGLSLDSVVTDFSALKKQVGFVSTTYGRNALVEEFIDGHEFNATVLGNSEHKVLPVSEIAYFLPPDIPKILTFAAKWEPGSPYFQGTRVVCPADIGTETQQYITKTVLAAFELLGGKGYARVDMRMDDREKLYVIEVNPNPDISPGSGAVRQAEVAGMNYTQFIGKIVELALERKQQWAPISVS